MNEYVQKYVFFIPKVTLLVWLYIWCLAVLLKTQNLHISIEKSFVQEAVPILSNIFTYFTDIKLRCVDFKLIDLWVMTNFMYVTSFLVVIEFYRPCCKIVIVIVCATPRHNDVSNSKQETLNLRFVLFDISQQYPLVILRELILPVRFDFISVGQKYYKWNIQSTIWNLDSNCTNNNCTRNLIVERH